MKRLIKRLLRRALYGKPIKAVPYEIASRRMEKTKNVRRDNLYIGTIILSQQQ